MTSEGISKFKEAYDARHQQAKRWKEQGRKVFGYIYSSTPEELIYAAGIVPVQLTESENKEMSDKGENYMPEFFCDYVHSLIGQVAAGEYDYLDGVLIPDNCTHIRTLAEIWHVNFKPPFFYFMSLPSVANETTRAFYIEELRRLKAAIEDFRGKPISDAELHSAIRVYNENRELLNKLYQLRSREKPPISGSEILQVVKAGLVMPREEHNNLLRELLERLSAREGESKGKTRIMVSVFAFEECAGEQPNFIRLMEQMGADVVCDDLCIGHRYFWKPVELKPDPLEALMDRYLGKVPVAYRMSAEERIGLMLDEALKYGARGAVVFIPKYCQICEFHYLYLDEKFKEQGIPTLLIETTSDMPEAPVRTRLQAFIEMLE